MEDKKWIRWDGRSAYTVSADWRVEAEYLTRDCTDVNRVVEGALNEMGITFIKNNDWESHFLGEVKNLSDDNYNQIKTAIRDAERAQSARLQAMNDDTTTCRSCRQNNWQGAMFTTARGSGLCDDCAA